MSSEFKASLCFICEKIIIIKKNQPNQKNKKILKTNFRKYIDKATKLLKFNTQKIKKQREKSN